MINFHDEQQMIALKEDRITKYTVAREAGVPADFARRLRDLTWPQFQKWLDCYHQDWRHTKDFTCNFCKRKTRPHRYKKTSFLNHIKQFHKVKYDLYLSALSL